MYHSITFYNGTAKFNTYDNWFLVPSKRPLVVPPTPKYKYVDVPGANGTLDFTDSLTGVPVYNNREGDWEFYVLNDHGEWYERYSNIMTILQGRSLKVILEDDPEYYYQGRFHVSEWASDKDYSKIKIHYNVAPYKIRCQETTRNGAIFLSDIGGSSL